MEKFKTLGLSAENLLSLHQKGFEEPTEIQAKTIPLLLENKIDIIAQAETGTGKTAAFALPLIELIHTPAKNVKAIILAPTRELVIQICEEINSLKANDRLNVVPIYGGQSMMLQLKQLKKGAAIVVGTPGRILDHIERTSLRLGGVDFFILDEADEMLNMGFIEDIEKILGATKKEKRVLLFSATMPDRIKKLAEKYMDAYKHIRTQSKITATLTDQIYFEVANRDKFEALCRIIDIEDEFYGLVFCRTRNDVDQLAGHLVDRGYAADGLHGDIVQAQREKILAKFRKQQTSILVATDVAARGIDVNDLTHVINYSIPHNPEAYIHRIGRTGRAGKKGTAITFVTSSEFKTLGFIKRIAKTDIRKKNVPRVKEIIKARRNKIVNDISASIGREDSSEYVALATRLLKDNAPVDVLAAVLRKFLAQSLDTSNYQELTPPKRFRQGKGFVEEEGATRLFIAKGKKDNLTKKDIIEFIVKKAGVPSQVIDNLIVHEEFSFISAPFKEAETILRKFKKVRVGRKAMVAKAKPAASPRGRKSRFT
ncbi:MAG: DEAD/DEAH box helicase [Chitinivibrionales bacterium]|nr:DEAD/DEAH box helicase [Chitinivibrionales bacterium]